MIIVEQGKVVEVCAEPGEFTYDTSSEPSIFAGNLGESIKETFKTVGKRFTYGGDTGKDQRVYYFNTKEILENRFGTPNPVPFRVVDSKIGLDIDVAIRCSGVYSYKIADPLLFYSNVCGNVEQEYSREELDATLKTEFISALQPAFGHLSELELRPNQIVTHNTDLENAMNTALSEKWGALRGLKVVSIALGSVTLPDEDAELIKQAQRTAIMRDPTMAAATLVGAQADAMKTAAGNEAGAMTGFMGMGMTLQGGAAGFGATLMSLTMIGNISTKLLIGIISDRFGPIRASVIMIVTNMISLVLMMAGMPGANTWILMTGSFVFGSIYAVGAVGLPLLTRYFFGQENYSIAYAKIGFLTSVGSSSSLTLIGYLYDFTGTYLYMLVIAMAFHVIDLCLLVIIRKKAGKEYNRG